MGKELKDMTMVELEAEKTKFQRMIDGPENDGRTTSGGSYSLDYWFDMIDEIDEEMKNRKAN